MDKRRICLENKIKGKLEKEEKIPRVVEGRCNDHSFFLVGDK